MRHWIEGPELKQVPLKSRPNARIFTVTAKRNDGTRCYVQDTHEFHLEGFTTEQIIAAAQQIAHELRARIDTYLHENCMCQPNQTVPCPINHSREKET